MKKTLDLRYNELLNYPDRTDELQDVMGNVHGGQLVLSWKNLNVSVKQVVQKWFKRPKTTYKKILDNVSGNVQCGTLLGIMGPSGSGKTTLMATISHRTKGNFDGELLLNGRPISEEVMMKISGFVPQHDICFDQLTALEHLSLMASLKMDRRTTEAEVKAHLDRIVQAIGMSEFVNTRISFLSGGERKKVSLAVQMLNDPPILFCDEITTGLDSYSAAHIVNILKRVARTGRIVVCTIHQPASGVFGKFDEVVLLSGGRLAYRGPVHAVHRLLEKFDYKCPDMFNEADFVMSILNCDGEKARRDVDEMCKLSLADKRSADVDYDFSDNQKQLDYTQHLRTQKPLWTTQFSLIINRSIKCCSRDYRIKLLDLGNILLLSLIVSSPFGNLQFGSSAAQNWQGFWSDLVFDWVFTITYSIVPVYYTRLSIIQREVQNEVYSLSAYYVSELIVTSFWIMIKAIVYCIAAFTVVGVHWGGEELFLFFTIAITAFSFGTLVSAYLSDMDYAFIFVNLYSYVGLSFSGLFLSLKSIPEPFYSLKRLSIFFLGVELVSTKFWNRIPYLPCYDVTNCLNSGKAVLDKYGFMSSEYSLDLTILFSFCVLANIFGYFGILRKVKKPLAY